MDELLAALHHCKNRKAPGIDGVNVELIKCAPALLHDRLLQFVNLCWTTGHVPDDWRIAKVFPLSLIHILMNKVDTQ